MLQQFLKDTKKYWAYALRAAKADLKSEVATNHLGWLWWILDPLLFMLIYSFVAIVVFNKNVQYLAAFIFVGLSCWDFFSKTIKQSVKLVSGNKPVVSKVYLPKFVLIYVRMMVNGFKMFISFSLVVGMMIIYQVPLTYRIIYFPFLLILLSLLTFGISCIMLHAGVFVEDLFNVINAFLRLVFYLSGIFYSLPDRVHGWIGFVLLKCNPFAAIITSMRSCVLYSSDPDFITMAIWLVIAVILTVIGVRLIYKNENSYVKVM